MEWLELYIQLWGMSAIATGAIAVALFCIDAAMGYVFADYLFGESGPLHLFDLAEFDNPVTGEKVAVAIPPDCNDVGELVREAKEYIIELYKPRKYPLLKRTLSILNAYEMEDALADIASNFAIDNTSRNE